METVWVVLFADKFTGFEVCLMLARAGRMSLSRPS